VRGVHVALHLADENFERRGNQFLERFSMALREGFAGDFVAEHCGEAVVIIKAGVVVTHGSEVYEAIKRTGDLRESAAAEVFGGLLNAHAV
jgi:hypothetical protein